MEGGCIDVERSPVFRCAWVATERSKLGLAEYGVGTGREPENGYGFQRHTECLARTGGGNMLHRGRK
jgi:hypothetical protein